MIQLHEVLRVNRPLEDVFKFVSNFRFIEQWDPGVVSSKKLTPGPVQAGTHFRLRLRYGCFCLKMRYTIVEYSPPYHVVLKGKGDSFSLSDTINFSQSPGARGKTEIDYTALFEFKDLKPTIELILKPLLGYMGKKSIQGLKKALACDPVQYGRPIASKACAGLIATLCDRSIIPGMIGFSKWGFKLSKHFWGANPSFLTNKTLIITGATSGIGKMAAMALAELDASVTLIARDRNKAVSTQQEIIQQTGNQKIDFYIADLSLMSEIERLSKQLTREKPVIDVLINNAGALFSERMETGEGFEKSFATNLLGVFFLTRQLLKPLSESHQPRIINVASGGMYLQKIAVNDLQNRQGTYDGATAYAQAKRGLIILTGIWAEQLRYKGFSVHAMHPGWVDTPGLKQSLPRFYRLTKPILRTPEQGADTIAWLASAREPALYTGGFWLDRRLHLTHVFSRTRESAEERTQLFQELTRLTGQK